MLTLITTFAFFLWMLQSDLFWVELWQRKEYRLDRLLVHLRETHQGRNILFSRTSLGVLLLLGLYAISIFLENFTVFFQIITTLFFMYQAYSFVKKIFKHRIKRPVVTIKSLFLVIATFTLATGISLAPLTDRFLWFVIVGVMIPLLVSVFVFLLSFPTEIYVDILIQRARSKLQKFKYIKVIAISGSYGKSSTKEIIEHILSEKYRVVKTPLSQNTPIALAKTILTAVTEETEFLIAEMGAYKKGELALLCNIARPNISVTTAISDQHISLYGGMGDVIASEKEVTDALPRDGMAILNGNDENIKILAKKIHVKKVFYNAQGKKYSPEIWAEDIYTSVSGVKFIACFKHGKKIQLLSPLLGVHTVENILPAIYLGYQFGLSDKQIQDAVKTLQPLPKTMEKVTLKNGAVAIDDTFNASPESVQAAISYLSQYSRRKVFVLTPLIELGKEARRRHYEIGKSLAMCNNVFLTNTNFVQEIQKGLEDVNAKASAVVGTPSDIAQILLEITKKGDAIVFEGKEAAFVLKQLI